MAYEKLTGIDLALSLRGTADELGVVGTRLDKKWHGLKLLVRNLRRNRIELDQITGWDTLRLWRYSTSMLATKHNVSFMNDPKFKKAYESAERAVGQDLWNSGIHFRIHQALWCADHAKHLEGDFVELGTGRGMMFSAILSNLGDWDKRATRVFLFDTFSSFSIDATTGQQSETLGTSPVYAESFERTRQTFAPWSRVQLVRGFIPDSLATVNIEKVTFLHIDLNTPAPEVAGLLHFWPKLVSGAIVLLDDYAHVNSESQYEAMNMVAEQLGVRILTLASGQGIILKP